MRGFSIGIGRQMLIRIEWDLLPIFNLSSFVHQLNVHLQYGGVPSVHLMATKI